MTENPEDTILPYEWEDADGDILRVTADDDSDIGYLNISSDGHVSTVYAPHSKQCIRLAKAVLEAGGVQADILIRETKPCSEVHGDVSYTSFEQVKPVSEERLQTITMPVEMQNKILERLEYLERKVMLLGVDEDEE